MIEGRSGLPHQEKIDRIGSTFGSSCPTRMSYLLVINRLIRILHSPCIHGDKLRPVMSIGVYLYRGYLCRLGVAGLEAQYLHCKYLDHVEAQFGAIVIQRI